VSERFGAGGRLGVSAWFWRPWEVADFVALLRPMMDAAGLKDVGITPGARLGTLPVEEGWVRVEVPARSAATLFAE
jgi:hypothetical protein